MTDDPPPDPLDRGQLAEAILAVERRVAVLEKERPIAKFGVSPARAWIMIFVVIAIAAIAFFWQPFAPKNYKQCAEDAAREAKTNGALGILLSACMVTATSGHFRGRRLSRPGGLNAFPATMFRRGRRTNAPNNLT